MLTVLRQRIEPWEVRGDNYAPFKPNNKQTNYPHWFPPWNQDGWQSFGTNRKHQTVASRSIFCRCRPRLPPKTILHFLYSWHNVVKSWLCITLCRFPIYDSNPWTPSQTTIVSNKISGNQKTATSAAAAAQCFTPAHIFGFFKSSSCQIPADENPPRRDSLIPVLFTSVIPRSLNYTWKVEAETVLDTPMTQHMDLLVVFK